MLHSVRIRSDGTPNGTTITTSRGEEVKNVCNVSMYLDVGDVAKVTLEIYMPMADVSAMLDEIIFECPVCTKSLLHHCHRPEGDDDAT